jgi:hypothetical protein
VVLRRYTWVSMDSKRWIRAFVILCAFAFSSAISLRAALPQEDSFSKNFKKFKDVISGVDFFAGNRADLAPFEKPIAEAREKLSAFLGDDLAKGAIVICSKLEPGDAGEPQISLGRTAASGNA